MTDSRTMAQTRDIVIEEEFPHAPETIWRTLTTGALIGRWLMRPTGFEPVVGNRFTFQTTPAGPWDGVIHCVVLDVVPEKRFAFSWQGGHPDNKGYGSQLETIVSWTLEQTANGTRIRLVHSGFVLPKNEAAFDKMGHGWVGVVEKVRDLAGVGDGGAAAGEEN